MAGDYAAVHRRLSALDPDLMHGQHRPRTRMRLARRSRHACVRVSHERNTGERNGPHDPDNTTPWHEPGARAYRVRGKPRSTCDVAGSGQRAVTTFDRV